EIQRHAMRRTLLSALISVSLSCAAQAADLGVTARRLVIRDTVAANGKAWLTYSSSNDAGIQKGPAGLTTLEGTFEVFYTSDLCSRSNFLLPQGSSWRMTTASTAKYVQSSAPAGGAVRRVTINNGKRLRVRAEALGDDPSWKLNLAAAGAPAAADG